MSPMSIGLRPSRLSSWVASTLLAIGSMLSSSANASGGGEDVDAFVTRQATDIPLNLYDRGDLGVVLATYPRVYLYPAWRAIALGRNGLLEAPTASGGAGRAVGRYVDGWVNIDDPNTSVGRWIANSNAVLGAKRLPIKNVIFSSDVSGFVNCPEAAFQFATETLTRLLQRSDSNPQRMSTWIQGQDAVFALCSQQRGKPTLEPGSPRNVGTGINVPEALPASEPLHWRQLREYQIAAAYFYAGNFDESASRFARIGATSGHAMQDWGAYLSLRSKVRRATLDLPESERLDARPTGRAAIALLAIERDVKAILGDSRLAAVHGAARATWRTAQFRLQPVARFEELSALLDDPARDPNQEDHLGDWRRLANGLFDYSYGPDKGLESLERRMRNRYEYFDWMRTIQRCALDAKSECDASHAHAIERWEQTSEATASHRVWLVAVLLVADDLPAQVEASALAVPESAPEYLTVRYNLSRLYRAANEVAKARVMSESALAFVQRSKLPSESATNLLRQERFAIASSVSDAATYLLRTPVRQGDPDTGDQPAHGVQKPTARPDVDGLAWINTRLSTADLMALASDERLNADTRRRLAVATWMRAELLGNPDLARKASLLAERDSPALEQAAKRYSAAVSAADRRHSLVLSALRLKLSTGLSLDGDDMGARVAELAKQDALDENVTASMWCSVGKDDGLPHDNVLAVSADADLRNKEIEALGRLKTATGFLGDHVLNRVKTQPNDRDLPWLLHVVIQSTKGGCLDKDSQQLSKTAHGILHKRFPDSVWAKKSPYWY